MQHQAICLSFFHRTVATLTALTVLVLLPGWSHASCGDHVRMPKQNQSLHYPQPDQPCTGPHCSGLPEKTPALPISLPSWPADQWAVVHIAADSPPRDRSFLIDAAIADRPRHLVFPLERPPRCHAS
jgi:hypothetical protein